MTLLNSDSSKKLPVPATFITGSNQKIVACRVEADYTQRMSALEIIDVLKEMKQNNQ